MTRTNEEAEGWKKCDKCKGHYMGNIEHRCPVWFVSAPQEKQGWEEELRKISPLDENSLLTTDLINLISRVESEALKRGAEAERERCLRIVMSTDNPYDYLDTEYFEGADKMRLNIAEKLKDAK